MRVRHAGRRTWIERWTRGLGACAVALAAACGGSPDRAVPPATEAPAADSTDPCTLVTSAEAERTLGGSVAAPERPAEANFPPSLTSCRYVSTRGQQVSVLSVVLRRSASETESRIGFTSAKEQLGQVQPIDGLGDDAFALGDQLHVRRGTAYLVIGGVPPDAAQRLAEVALERLR